MFLKMSSAEVVCCMYLLGVLTYISISTNSVDQDQTVYTVCQRGFLNCSADDKADESRRNQTSFVVTDALWVICTVLRMIGLWVVSIKSFDVRKFVSINCKGAYVLTKISDFQKLVITNQITFTTNHQTNVHGREKMCLFTQLLTLCLLVSSADNICKQFGPRSGSIKHRT